MLAVVNPSGGIDFDAPAVEVYKQIIKLDDDPFDELCRSPSRARR